MIYKIGDGFSIFCIEFAGKEGETERAESILFIIIIIFSMR